MKMSDELAAAFNKQVEVELNSWYLYKAIEAWFNDCNLDGFAHWMRLQATEELGHAERLADYLIKRGNSVEYGALNTPAAKFSEKIEVVEAVYKHEMYISRCIETLTKQAIKEGDLGAASFLDWYVKEQEEEEVHTLDLVNKVKMIGESAGLLYQLNKELKKRT